MRATRRRIAALAGIGVGAGGRGGFWGGRRGSRGVFREPLAEERDGEPVDVAAVRTDAVAAAGEEGEAEEAALNACDDVGELVDFVFDELDDLLGEGLAEVTLAHRPLAHDVDEGFGEDDFGAGHVAEAEVGGGVLGDLLEEAGLELEEVVVDARADYYEGVVHVC